MDVRGRWSVSAGCNPVASCLVGSNPTTSTISLYTHAHKCVGHADIVEDSIIPVVVLVGSIPTSVQLYKDGE